MCRPAFQLGLLGQAQQFHLRRTERPDWKTLALLKAILAIGKHHPQLVSATFFWLLHHCCGWHGTRLFRC